MPNAKPTDIFNLCKFKFANGRVCGLPAHPKHDGLCLSHARLLNDKPPQREDDLATELASPGGDFTTQIDINHVLGKLFDALASNRVSTRRASTLAYIACQLAQTQKGAIHEAVTWASESRIIERIAKIKFPPDPENGPQSAAKPKQ